MKFFKKIYWWSYIIILSLRWVRKINIHDKVIYNGKVYIISDGVHYPKWDIRRYDPTWANDPVWGCMSKGLDKDGNPNRICIDEKLLYKVRSLRNYWGSFAFGYYFYMTNWFDIWVDEGIKPWMRGCNIWGKR